MNWLFRLFAPRSSVRANRPDRPRLAVEALESRLVPTVTYHGGNLLPSVEVQGIYLGSNWATDPSLNPSIPSYEAYLSLLVNSSYMDMLTQAGYNVGRGSGTPGVIDPTVLGTTRYLTDAHIQGLLQNDISAGLVAQPDANRLYVIFVEPDIVVRDSYGGNSNRDFAGYHGAFAGQTAGGQPADIRYAVLPYAGGSVGNLGIGPGYSAFQSATVIASHEITEAATDPDGDAWYQDDQNSDEIGDLAQGNFVNYHGYFVQAEVDQHDNLISPSWLGLPEVASDLTHSDEYYSNLIVSVYQKYLGRTPASSELAGWLGDMKGGLSDEQLEAGFIGSPEYIANHGGPGAGWVTGMYHDLLGRAPLQIEVQGWVNALNNGTTPTQVAYGFAASRERETQRIQADYQTYLGRPASQSEVNGWVIAFLNGYSNENVIAGFVGSQEYFQRQGSDPRTWLDSAYRSILGRPADTSAFNSWLPLIEPLPIVPG
jgi:hypothetical protein